MFSMSIKHLKIIFSVCRIFENHFNPLVLECFYSIFNWSVS